MKYLKAYIKSLYYTLGVMGILYMVSNFFIGLELLPLIMVYTSVLVAFAGPIKIFIENKA